MSSENVLQERYKAILFSSIVIVLILLVGTLGYYHLGNGRFSLLECFYMTFITITTIGYGEIIELDTTGRVFTVLISLCGIGILMYLVSNVSALLVEGELREVFKEKKMQKNIKALRGHYIVCGAKGVGFHIVCELRETMRPVVVVDPSRENLTSLLQRYPDLLYIIGDATQEEILKRAGVERAIGLFAASGDDNLNLVITLTAKYLNPEIKVVARCKDVAHMEKMKKAGADRVVSPTFIGGLRMASEMVRPVVVSFLDIMLRDKDKRLRIEEIPVSGKHRGSTLRDWRIKEDPEMLLLAIKRKESWIYNPPEDYVLEEGDYLVVMTTPEARKSLEKRMTSS
jgi:voltage-gated potassium channel